MSNVNTTETMEICKNSNSKSNDNWDSKQMAR